MLAAAAGLSAGPGTRMRMSEEMLANPLSQSPAIAQICVPDLAAGADFYQNTLAFEGQQVTPNAWSFQCGGGSFSVFQDPNTNPSGNTQVVWPVADIRATIAWLKSRGVDIVKDYGPMLPLDGEGVFSLTPDGPHAAWFDDPWGNNLQIFQPPSA